MQMDLGIVIPVYNEAAALQKHFEVIQETVSQIGISVEYMLVDDGSSDDTWQVILHLFELHPNVTAMRFARNFGKEMAICAGLDALDAGMYLVMDSDLQHPPALIKDMLALMESSGADIVEGIKSARGGESFLYKLCARGFYKTLHFFTGLSMDNSSDFKLMKGTVVDSIRRFNETDLFFRGLVDWVGFKKEPFPFDVEERENGASSFSFMKLVKLSLDATLAYTSRPLYLTLIAGIAFLIFAIILGVQSLVNYFTGVALSGFSTVILVLLIASSMIMISLGIIGVYVSRIYNEVKRRPKYIVADKTAARDS